MSKPAILVTRSIFPDVLERLGQYFDVETNPLDQMWSQDELVQRLQGKVGVFTTGVERITESLLDRCPDLRVCSNMTVGYNNFDLVAMTAAGVLGTNAPDVLTETTADFGFALLMATARRVTESEHYLRAGKWTRWSYDMFSGSEVHGSTLGIIGMGRIGQAIARRGAYGFGMKVVYHNRSRLAAATEMDCKATYLEKDELLRTADHVMLVVPYSPASHHTIGAAELAIMKPTATLINIARGGIVDDAALAIALRQGQIASAGLDVYEGEPSVHPDLLSLSNVVLTPHIASATEPTRRAMAMLAVDNLIGYLVQDKPVTPLNPQVIQDRNTVWDPRALELSVGDNAQAQQRLRERFLSHVSSQISDLMAHGASGDLVSLADVAHRLKSAARTVGAMRLGEVSQSLEAACRQLDLPKAITLVEQVSAAFSDVLPYLRKT